MKTFFVICCCVAFLLSCDKDTANRNPYLPETGFSFEINLNLPLYSNLNVPGNSIYIGNPGVGIKGIFVTNNGTSFYAWEASCPNHSPNDCSTMIITKGIYCRCNCEDYTYNFFTGGLTGDNQPEGQPYGLLSYNARSDGNVVIVSN